MACDVSCGDLHSEKWLGSDQKLGHEGPLSRDGLGALARGEMTRKLGQASRAGLVSFTGDGAPW
jgi:hypothetical protein